MQKLKEKEIVKKLTDNLACLNDAIFFAVNPALHLDDDIIECSLHIALEVPRSLLNLKPDQKPGDFDLLIIPERKGVIHFDRTIAIEIKVVRPTLSKPSKNAGKMGATQTNGIVADGFPFVGLLHLEVPENTPYKQKEVMPNDYLMDMFPLESSMRQNGRLKQLELPSFVGYSSTGLASTEIEFIGSTFGIEKNCEINPNINSEIINSVEKLFYSNNVVFNLVQTYG